MLLPPWTRAPGLGFRNPAVFFAVAMAAAILACASSSAALFLSSSSSAALHQLVAARCADAALPTVQVASTGAAPRPHGGVTYPPGLLSAPAYARMNRTATEAFTRAGLPAPRVRLSSLGWVSRSAGQLYATGSKPADQSAVTLFYQDGALANVRKVTSAGGRGVWITDTEASFIAARAGGAVRVEGVPVRVAGIYADMGVEPVRPFWCSQQILFKNPSSNYDIYPPKLMIFTDPEAFAAVDHRVADDTSYRWIAPIDTRNLTLSHARTLVADQQQAQRRIGAAASALGVPDVFTTDAGSLHDMTDRTSLIRQGLIGPVLPIAIGGSLLALLLVGAAGSYWADRRFREVRLLASRGVGGFALAMKAAAELVAAALVGTAGGWALAIGLVKLLGPSRTLDAAAPGQAAATAAGGFVAGMLLLATVAGIRGRNTIERPVGHRRSVLAMLPWELLVLAGAAAMYLRLRQEAGVTLVHDVAQVNLLVVAFPLVFLLGATALLVRLLALGLPVLRRLSARWPVAGYLAAQRISGAAVASVTLLAAASVPIAVLVYSGGITGTTARTTDAKAQVYAGAPITVSTTTPIPRSAALDRVGTAAVRYARGTLGGTDVEVLAIDPSTFARVAYWDRRFAGGSSLAALTRKLSRKPADGRLPAIVWHYRDNTATGLNLGPIHRRLDVIGTVAAFPGLRDNYADLVVVDAARLGAVQQTLVDQNAPISFEYELWTRGREAVADRVITAAGGVPFYTVTPTTVIVTTNYVAVTWTFGYLEALAALVGLIAAGGLLLYLATRQRARTSAYVLARRMGLAAATNRRSLVIELVALLGAAWIVGVGLSAAAIALVYRRLDPDTTHPPTPLLTLPITAVLASAGVGLLVALISALIAHRISEQANPSEVLRTDA
ncbi:MAG: hypothetical protein ACR2FF_05935 [Mycobacteriales bacterium]